MNTAWLLLACALAAGQQPAEVRIASKSFTESVILGEVAAHLARHEGHPVRHRRDLGGTRVLWDALLADQIDVYPEYTGTLHQEIFSQEALPDDQALRRQLARQGIVMTEPLGFNNSYAIGMKRRRAEQLGIETISDLRRHPDLRLGFSNEFMSRGDGWPSLRTRYDLPHRNVTGLEHALAYESLNIGGIDAVDVYTTDPHVEMYDLRVLRDDLEHFPRYEAVFLYRQELEPRAPRFIERLSQLTDTIDDARMADLNRRVQITRDSETRAAADFVKDSFGFTAEVHEPRRAERVWRTTVEHLWLVAISLAAAILVSVPLGIVSAKKPLLGQLILGTVEVIQTIPGLALLVFMAVAFVYLGLPTIGPWPVIGALFLYSLLPIIRNTMTGLASVPGSLVESADALGLSPWDRLRLVELPLASPMILAGIKTTAVINVGYAALGGLIGAGGYGQPIMTGLRLNSNALMMEGAIPAAVLALLVKGFFTLVERRVVPRGLRIAAS